MKLDLSPIVVGLDGNALKRSAVNKEFGDEPLTLAFALAHVLSVAVEDVGVLEQAAANPANPDADSVRARAFAMKVERGNLALRLAAVVGDAATAVELTPEELVLLKTVAGPRLMPIVLAQVNRVIG